MNLPTAIIGLLVLVLFAAITAKLVRDKRNGKGGCSCGGDCAHCGACHSRGKAEG